MKIKLILSIILASIITTNFAGDFPNKVTEEFVHALEMGDQKQFDKLLPNPDLDLTYKIEIAGKKYPILEYSIRLPNKYFAKAILKEADYSGFMKRRDKNKIINEIGSNGETALITALFVDIDFALELIKEGADVNAQDKWDHTPLLLAINKNNKDLVKALINAGVNVNPKTKEIPLHRAVSRVIYDKQNLEIVQLLLDAKADVNTKDEYDNTALDYAYYNNHIELINLLKKYGAEEYRRKEFIDAIEKNDVDKVKKLLNKWNLTNPIAFNFNFKINDKIPVLIYVILEDKDEIALEIIKKIPYYDHYEKEKQKKLINAKTYKNETALIAAVARKKSYNLISDLIYAGIDVNAQADDGSTALMLAILNDDERTAKFLISKGASFIIETKEGKKHIADFAKSENQKKKILAFEASLKK